MSEIVFNKRCSWINYSRSGTLRTETWISSTLIKTDICGISLLHVDPNVGNLVKFEMGNRICPGSLPLSSFYLVSSNAPLRKRKHATSKQTRRIKAVSSYKVTVKNLMNGNWLLFLSRLKAHSYQNNVNFHFRLGSKPRKVGTWDKLWRMSDAKSKKCKKFQLFRSEFKWQQKLIILEVYVYSGNGVANMSPVKSIFRLVFLRARYGDFNYASKRKERQQKI